jgi:hypothetical protein
MDVIETCFYAHGDEHLCFGNNRQFYIEVHTVVNIKLIVFRYVMPYSLIARYQHFQHFEGTCSPHLPP